MFEDAWKFAVGLVVGALAYANDVDAPIGVAALVSDSPLLAP
jgi:hypothetical protein